MEKKKKNEWIALLGLLSLHPKYCLANTRKNSWHLNNKGPNRYQRLQLNQIPNSIWQSEHAKLQLFTYMFISLIKDRHIFSFFIILLYNQEHLKTNWSLPQKPREPNFFKKIFFSIYSFMSHTEREAETQTEGEAGSSQGAWCQDSVPRPRIMPWAEGSHLTTEPPRCPENQISKIHREFYTD